MITMVDDAVNNYPGNPLLGKFRYWKGMALARQNHIQEAVSVFQGIINAYPTTDSIVPLAQVQLNYLMESDALPESDEVLAENKMISSKDTTLTPVVQTSENQESVLSAEAQLFRYREKMQHYVIVIV